VIPRVNDECQQCLKVKPLLMPVQIDSIGGEYTELLCLDCRKSWEDGEWATLATTIQHSRFRDPRHPHRTRFMEACS
jgi:hypothetical protein